MSIIETRDLAKRYGKARGVRNASLRIEEGFEAPAVVSLRETRL
jgi:ABC-type multidrug transport system ATPase subunit